MPPTTKRVCLAALDATKHICMNIPTVEGLKVLLARFHREVLVEHPYASAAILLLWAFYPLFPFHLLYFLFYVIPRNLVLGILTCLGFEGYGLRADSPASRYQSRNYGGFTPRNSVFSRSQSYGTTGLIGQTGRPQANNNSWVIWRIVGWLILYGLIVVLLKYGPRNNWFLSFTPNTDVAMGLFKYTAIAVCLSEAIAEWPILISIETPIAHFIAAYLLLSVALGSAMDENKPQVRKNPLLAFLEMLGFREEGVKKGSRAADLQSRYKGYVPKGSSFAKRQSDGALGARKFPGETIPGSITLSWDWFEWALLIRCFNHVAAAIHLLQK